MNAEPANDSYSARPIAPVGSDVIPMFLGPAHDQAPASHSNERLVEDTASHPPLVLPADVAARPYRDEIPARATLPTPDASTPFPWWQIPLGICLGLLAAIFVAKEWLEWDSALARLHPALRYGSWICLLLLVLALLGLAYRRIRRYSQLRNVSRLRARLRLGAAQGADLKPAAFGDSRLGAHVTDYVLYLHRIGLVSGEGARAFEQDCAISHALEETIVALDRHVLPEMDARAKAVIEGQARAVGLYTALAPSGIIDSGLVLWRNTQLVLQIADVYGVHPGWLGSARLVRRVLTNVATAAVTQQALHMFHIAYGATVAQAGGKLVSGVGGALAAAGKGLLLAHPHVGVPLATGGEAIRHLGRGAGEAAEALSGPLFEGLLTAALTVRVGLEAQQECRLFPMTEAQQENLTAGTLTALVGFFRRITPDRKGDQPAPEPAPQALGQTL